MRTINFLLLKKLKNTESAQLCTFIRRGNQTLMSTTLSSRGHIYIYNHALFLPTISSTLLPGLSCTADIEREKLHYNITSPSLSLLQYLKTWLPALSALPARYGVG